jgi:hypothetical protein
MNAGQGINAVMADGTEFAPRIEEWSVEAGVPGIHQGLLLCDGRWEPERIEGFARIIE